MTVNLSSRYRSCLITGASGGIGRAFALRLAKQTDSLWLCGRDLKALEETMRQVRELSPSTQVACLVHDLSIPQERAELIHQVRDTQLELLVLNAGAGHFKAFTEAAHDEAENMLALNIGALVELSSELVPLLIKNARANGRRAGFISVSSHASYMRVPNFAVYGACKAFINSFVMTLAQELRDEPIDILVVAPGATESRFSARSGIPTRMMTKPGDPAIVAHKSVEALGNKNLLIVDAFDRVIYVASRVLPVSIFDRVVSTLQKMLLARTQSRTRRSA